jgi:hypothetical protein
MTSKEEVLNTDVKHGASVYHFQKQITIQRVCKVKRHPPMMGAHQKIRNVIFSLLEPETNTDQLTNV